MVTATVASPPDLAAEQRVLLPRVSWATYERLLADDEGRQAPRLTYDRGVLEIVSPSSKHERDNLAIAEVVGLVAEELGIDYLPVGSTTFRRESMQKGFEADSSFYIRGEATVRGQEEIDLRTDPPPDLVIEIDVSHPSLDKLPIYAAMGVPEVWRAVGDRLTILVLEAGGYREVDASVALPPLTGDVLARFLVASRSQRRLAWKQAVRAWAREQRGNLAG